MSERCPYTVAQAERYARDPRSSTVANFAAHLDGCERCQRRVDRLNDELANAVVTLPEMAPPPELRAAMLAAAKAPNASAEPAAPVTPKGRVVARLGESPSTTRSTPGWQLAQWVAVAAALILGLGVGWVAHPSQPPIVSQFPVALPAGASLSLVRVGVHRVSGSASFVGATDQHSAYLVLLGVTPPAAGKNFTLWYLTPNGKTSKAADVTSVTHSGVYTVENPPANLTGMAISVEPQPHEVAPTGPLVFATD